jgi:hypothetical protein
MYLYGRVWGLYVCVCVYYQFKYSAGYFLVNLVYGVHKIHSRNAKYHLRIFQCRPFRHIHIHIHSLNTESYCVRHSHTVHCVQVQLSNHYNQHSNVGPYSTPTVHIQNSCDSLRVWNCFRWLSSCPYIPSEYRVHICVLGHQNRRVLRLGHRWQIQSRAVCVTTVFGVRACIGQNVFHTRGDSKMRSYVWVCNFSWWVCCKGWCRHAWTLLFRCWW